jgi:hypothetical protein
MKTVKELGWVDLSEKVVVSDPCYDRDVWCMQTGVPVKPGRYKVFILLSNEKDWGVRVANLVLVHEDHQGSPQKDWESVGSCIGVDSGQCGVFDDAVYPQSKDHPNFEPFYEECCNLTLSKDMAGILANGKGVVTSSGFGDGSYELLAKKDGDRCVALMLDYDLVEMRTVMRALAQAQGD